MIKEALEYIVGLKTPFIAEIDGKKYSDKKLGIIEPTKYYADSFKVTTLSSFVEYIKSNKDKFDYGKAIIHIESYNKVLLFSALDEFKRRESYIECKADVPAFDFGRFYDTENFNIKLQALFCDAADKSKVLKIAGNIKSENADTVADDGVTQVVRTKKGVVLGEDEFVPNPVELAPYRTFTEIDQPVSKFIFRINNGPEMALFEADGGAWKLVVIQRIKEYLTEAMEEDPNTRNITILA